MYYLPPLHPIIRSLLFPLIRRQNLKRLPFESYFRPLLAATRGFHRHKAETSQSAVQPHLLNKKRTKTCTESKNYFELTSVKRNSRSSLLSIARHVSHSRSMFCFFSVSHLLLLSTNAIHLVLVCTSSNLPQSRFFHMFRITKHTDKIKIQSALLAKYVQSLIIWIYKKKRSL